MEISHNNPDLEPLIASNTNGTKLIKKEKKDKHFGLSRKRDAKSSKLHIIGVLGFFIFLLIYLSFAQNLRPYQHMVVHIPDDDITLPGPKELNNSTTINTTESINFKPIIEPVPQGFLVWGNYCKIPDINPLAKDVMKLFSKEDFEPCTKKPPMTSIEQNFENDTVKIILHKDLITSYLTAGQNYVECSYQEITRSGENATADDKYSLSESNYFEDTFQIPATAEFILIQCKASTSDDKKKVIYSNAHALIRNRREIQKKLDDFKTLYPVGKRPLSVLMVGIDSISRLNLIRAMPNTAQHLYDTGWFELKGYNKVDDNTYPNLMAVLAGLNNSLSYSICDPKQVGKLDQCPFIWKYFQDSGYITAYAEDEAKINTFNYHKFGFINQPTDYYFRPFGLAAEKYLKTKLKSTLKFCLGFQNYADYIYQYASDFATLYKEHPIFGLFWTNTFSHNEISDPSSMDLRMKYYLDELNNRGVLNNSMVVFLSDHGLRFGPVRQLLTGWLEERLPFIFIWLPEWFKKQHPEIVQNLKINRNRLTNPYDLHMTLKHVLELSGRIDNLPVAQSCQNCQSLFKEVPHNRSCEQISIESHWCTCKMFEETDKKSSVVKEAVKFVLNYINGDLEKHAQPNNTKKLCAKLQLKNILLSKKSEVFNIGASNEYVDYLLIIEVTPSGGKFETTVRHSTKSKKFEITGSISRLNQYASQSACISIDNLRKYCYCLKKKKRSGK